ncbi:hypothetical protein Syun_006821 [Stephania yunnanensis]|uniref:Uncharacterized protein n=1 Tax=Stephania yunnanensis TaxID=152371 RepID=A0AAP0PYV1_9MAGN
MRLQVGQLDKVDKHRFWYKGISKVVYQQAGQREDWRLSLSPRHEVPIITPTAQEEQATISVCFKDCNWNLMWISLLTRSVRERWYRVCKPSLRYSSAALHSVKYKKRRAQDHRPLTWDLHCDTYTDRGTWPSTRRWSPLFVAALETKVVCLGPLPPVAVQSPPFAAFRRCRGTLFDPRRYFYAFDDDRLLLEVFWKTVIGLHDKHLGYVTEYFKNNILFREIFLGKAFQVVGKGVCIIFMSVILSFQALDGAFNVFCNENAKLQRRRQELTQTTPDQQVVDEAV